MDPRSGLKNYVRLPVSRKRHPVNVIPTEVEGSFLQTGKPWVRERRKRKYQGVVRVRAHVCIWRQCNKDPSAALGMTVLGEWIGSQGRCAACLEDGNLVSQPSPLGEGAPQGRIG